MCAVRGIVAGGALYWLGEADIIISSDDAQFFDPYVSYVDANISRWSRGTERPQDAPTAKLMFSELGVELARFALEPSGEAGLLVEGDSGAIDHGRWQDEFLYARAFTIAGGSSGIMRNIIAERGLQMPR